MMRRFLKVVGACAVAVSAEVFVSDSQDDSASFTPSNVVAEDIRELATVSPAASAAASAASASAALSAAALTSAAPVVATVLTTPVAGASTAAPVVGVAVTTAPAACLPVGSTDKAIGNPWKCNIVYITKDGTKQLAPVKSAMTYALLTMFLGICGVDRCYTGHVCYGVVKGLTFGGCFVWAMIDYIIFIYVCITQRGSVDHLGNQANFKTDSLSGGWWVAAIALAFICCSILMQVCAVLGLSGKGGGNARSYSSEDDSSE